jgi:hypothetical protein
MTTSMIEKTIENRPVKFLKKLKFEIKNSKKIRVHFKTFVQNRIQKFKVTNAIKFSEGGTVGKTRIKRKPTGYLHGGNHRTLF